MKKRTTPTAQQIEALQKLCRPGAHQRKLPNPERMNPERARSALRAVVFYALDGGEDFTNFPVDQRAGIFEQNAADFLADFAHLCDRQGWDYADMLRRAKSHYREETDRQGSQMDNAHIAVDDVIVEP
jgi:hypothetical protein